MASGQRLPKRLLFLVLVAIVIVQSATTAFSQEEVPPTSSAQQSAAPGDEAKSRVLQFPKVHLLKSNSLMAG
jgi:hypothetical protein